MKNLLVILVGTTALAGSAQAQRISAARVPRAAVATFQKTFPAGKAVKWEKEGADYEAEFTTGKAEMSAVITAAGVLKETETELAMSQLPASVQKALAMHYQSYKITEAAKIVTAATGVTTYEAEVSQGGEHRDVLFNADGTEIAKK